jgi:DNA-binding FrmR family transcriptional regulator
MKNQIATSKSIVSHGQWKGVDFAWRARGGGAEAEPYSGTDHRGGRYCVEVLGQISAVQEALRGVGKLIMRNYLENCVTSSLRSGSNKKARDTYPELMDVIYKFAK